MKELIANLRDQHAGLLREAMRLQTRLQTPGWAEDPEGAARQVHSFVAAVQAHLSLEDERFYPQALADPRVRDRARRFQTDMGHLKETVNAFLEAWSEPAPIRSDPAGFEHYGMAFLVFLRRRIRLEEEELYPVLEKEGPDGLL